MGESRSENGWTREELERQIAWLEAQVVKLEKKVEIARSGVAACRQELGTIPVEMRKP